MDARFTPSTSTMQVGSKRNVPVLYPRDLAAAFNNRNANITTVNDGRQNFMKRRASTLSAGLPKVINGEGMMRRVGGDGPMIVDQPMEHAPYVSETDEQIPERKNASPPPTLSYMDLPTEFLNHFRADFFRVDMNTLEILSKHIREKVEYITKAAEVYPRHPSFIDQNYNAFERNLEVIKQAGQYFEPMLGFEDDMRFYPNAASAMGTALTICIQNNTAVLSQFAASPVDTEILPGCKLSKHGMKNLAILLDGILTEAEGMIQEYDKWKTQPTVNKVKMMMMTLQFSRYYRLAGVFAESALAYVEGDTQQRLASELNRITLQKLDDVECTDFDVTASSYYSNSENVHQNGDKTDGIGLDALLPSESRSPTIQQESHSSTVSLPSTVTNSPDNNI